MTLVVDTSVTAKWYLPEEGSDLAAALLESEEPIVAPDLLAAEFGNVIWKRVRRGELTAAEGAEIVSAFSGAASSAGRIRLLPSLAYLAAAFEIAATYETTVYDSLYLAVAVAEGSRLVTADAALVSSLAGTALASYVCKLDDAIVTGTAETQVQRNPSPDGSEETPSLSSR